MKKEDSQVSVVLSQNVRKDKFSEFEAVIRVSLLSPHMLDISCAPSHVSSGIRSTHWADRKVDRGLATVFCSEDAPVVMNRGF